MIAHSTPFPLIVNCMTRSRGYFLAVCSTLLDLGKLNCDRFASCMTYMEYLYENKIQILMPGISPVGRMNINYFIPISW